MHRRALSHLSLQSVSNSKPRRATLQDIQARQQQSCRTCINPRVSLLFTLVLQYFGPSQRLSSPPLVQKTMAPVLRRTSTLDDATAGSSSDPSAHTLILVCIAIVAVIFVITFLCYSRRVRQLRTQSGLGALRELRTTDSPAPVPAPTAAAAPPKRAADSGGVDRSVFIASMPIIKYHDSLAKPLSSQSAATTLFDVPPPSSSEPISSSKPDHHHHHHSDWHFSTCSICTDDFTEGVEVRQLTCEHIFHPACVDPWLKGFASTCPLWHVFIPFFLFIASLPPLCVNKSCVRSLLIDLTSFYFDRLVYSRCDLTAGLAADEMPALPRAVRIRQARTQNDISEE